MHPSESEVQGVHELENARREIDQLRQQLAETTRQRDLFREGLVSAEKEAWSRFSPEELDHAAEHGILMSAVIAEL